MDNYQKYLEEIMNNYYNEFKPIIERVRNYKCPNCGGTYIDSNCKYCNSKNNELEQDINKINYLLNNFKSQIINLPIKEININKLFNLLYSLNDTQECINKFLNDFNYQKNFYEFAKNTVSKMNDFNAQFTDLEINCIETLIYRNNNDFNLNYIYQYFINRCANGLQNVSLASYQTLIKQFTENILRNYYRNSECILRKYEKYIDGEKAFIQTGGNRAHKIWLNIDVIENMYYHQNNDILNTIFHEATHGVQHKDIFYGKQEIDQLVLLEIQDHILSKYQKNYYETNYQYISFENEAEYYGIILANKYLNNDINNNPKLIYKLTRLKESLLIKKRYIDSKESDIDTIFNEFIYNHPEIFKQHPQLKHVYKISDGKVIQLTKEEMAENYQNIISNDNLNEEQKTKYKQFYSQYITIENKQNKH